jgi:hypothetical protein
MKSLFHSEYRRQRNSIRNYLFTFFIFGIIMIGCSPAPTFIKSDFTQKQIKSIAIMPVVDKRNVVEDTSQSHKSLINIEELLSKKIVEKNYDFLSPGSVKNIIKEKAIENMSPQNLCSALKVDGILFSKLFNYSDLFFVNHSIKMGFKIFDAQGDSLWTNDMDDSDKPFLTAFGAALGWGIGVAVDNKISSESKLPTILAGVVASELVYTIVDALTDETSQSIDKVFKSLPERKGIAKEIVK